MHPGKLYPSELDGACVLEATDELAFSFISRYAKPTKPWYDETRPGIREHMTGSITIDLQLGKADWKIITYETQVGSPAGNHVS